MINSFWLVWKEPQWAAVLTAGGSDMKVMLIKAHQRSWWDKQMVGNDSHLLWDFWLLLKCLRCPCFMLIAWRLLRIWEKQRSWLVPLHRHWEGGWGLLGPWRLLLLSQNHWHCVGWWQLPLRQINHSHSDSYKTNFWLELHTLVPLFTNTFWNFESFKSMADLINLKQKLAIQIWIWKWGLIKQI